MLQAQPQRPQTARPPERPTSPAGMIDELEMSFTGVNPEQYNRQLVAELEGNVVARSQQVTQAIQAGQIPSPAWLREQLNGPLTPEARAMAEQAMRGMFGQGA